MTDELLPIVIDTSVFMHIRNVQVNQGRHIDILLSKLAYTHQLQIDKARKIEVEYKRKLEDMIKNMDEQRFEKQILQFWILTKEKNVIDLEPSLQFSHAVEQIINDKTKNVDRCLVETAALTSSDLVTNDGVDILDNANDLNRVIKKNRMKKVRFMNSQKAYDTFCTT
jgi:Fe2+ transport system protein B